MSVDSDAGGSFDASEGDDRKADTMYAVFITADIPVEVVNELLEEARYRGDDTDLRIMDAETISSLHSIEYPTDGAVERLNDYFFTWNPDQVYAWWKQHIQYRDQNAPSHWAYFSFIILDAEAISENENSAPTMLMCCDAPDFGEANDEIKLKVVRSDFEDGLEYMLSFEMLSMCPSEKGSEFVVSIQPPPTMMPTEEPGVFSVAPPEFARRNKKTVLMQLGVQKRQQELAQ